MARVVQRVDGEWYVPDIEGNREDPEPFKVRIKTATAARVREIEQSTLGAKVHAGEMPNFLARSQRLQERLIEDFVSEVTGYIAEDVETGERYEPKTGKELVDAVMRASPSELAVLADIADAIQSASKLKAGLLGNFASP